MEFEDVISESLSYSISCNGVFHWDKVGVFSEPVHHNQNHVLVVRSRKTFHKIHAYVAPGKVWDWQRLEQPRVLAVFSFVYLTGWALLNIRASPTAALN